MIEGVILAAGLSSRFHRSKMSELINEKSILEHTIENMLPCVDHIYVVIGHYKELIANNAYITCIYNENYMEGMFTSIKKGLSMTVADRVFIIPGDYPFVQPEIYEALASNIGDIIVPSRNNRGGHPILISRKIIEDVLESKEPHLRAVLNKYDKKYVVVDSDSVLTDIDTQNDLENSKGRFK